MYRTALLHRCWSGRPANQPAGNFMETSELLVKVPGNCQLQMRLYRLGTGDFASGSSNTASYWQLRIIRIARSHANHTGLLAFCVYKSSKIHYRTQNSYVVLCLSGRLWDLAVAVRFAVDATVAPMRICRSELDYAAHDVPMTFVRRSCTTRRVSLLKAVQRIYSVRDQQTEILGLSDILAQLTALGFSRTSFAV